MNVLFLSLFEIKNSDSGSLYADLVREFARNGHKVWAITPTCIGKTESFVDDNGVRIIRVKNGQIQKTGRIKKVLNLLTLESKTINAVKEYADEVKFDLIVNMCSNLCYTKTAAYFKKRDKAIYYLLIKDIFPQNAVDIGMLKTGGIMGIAYNHFRKKEKALYKSADYIGCMSRANREYILAHNDDIEDSRVTIVPNSISCRDVLLTESERIAMRDKYEIPRDKTVFVYGGNLGKPQGIEFIEQCLQTQKQSEDKFFLIVGSGTEYERLKTHIEETRYGNVKLLAALPKADYDGMISACDIGMIFLDNKFTVPNYPSRLVSYMQAALPIVSCTDKNTDIGRDIVDNGFGWWCESGDVEAFTGIMKEVESANLKAMGKVALNYLIENFSVAKAYSDMIEVVSR